MDEPEKPFSCPERGCCESFTNADRLAVHAKKHDLVLQLENKGGAYVADQTPTPTRFIRNCEEVGLFQDLQNVNIFEDSFKREMEARSAIPPLNLENHLITSTSDDTLHTPHIYPLDVASPNIFISKSNDNQQNLATSVNSNDVNEQIDKSLMLSVEDHLSSLSNQSKDDMLQNSSIPKKNKKSQLKLIRQNSVDLTDSEMIKDVTNTNKLGNKRPSAGEGLKSRRIIQCNYLKEIKIPVIAISDSSKNSAQAVEMNTDRGKNVDNFVKLNDRCQNQAKDSSLLSVSDIDKDNLKSPVKNSFFSQKSIEIALANFSNEASQRILDLNNISIEEIPSTEINNDLSMKTPVIEIDNKQINNLENRNSPFENSNIVYSNKGNLTKSTFILDGKLLDCSKDILNNIEILDSHVHNTDSLNSLHRQTVISQSDYGNSQSLSKPQNMYVLECPTGEKVYLQQIHKENNLQKTSVISEKDALPKIVQNIPSKSIVDNHTSVLVKRKLQDTIKVNAKKHDNNHLNPKFPIRPLNAHNSSHPLEDCIILPQPITINKQCAPINVSNCIQLLSVDLVPSTLEKNSSFKYVSTSTTVNKNLKLKNNMKHVSNSIDSTNRSKASKDERKICVTENEIDNRKATTQVRNRAAVWRYRNRQKQWNQNLEKKNNDLELENKSLTMQLVHAQEELKRLRNTLALHENCSITLQQNSTGVIKPIEILNVNFENSRSNQTMVIVENNKNSNLIGSTLHNDEVNAT